MKFRPRFSLRTLIVAITLICAILGSFILSYQVEFRRESAIAARVQKNGGMVSWEAQTPFGLRWLGNPQFFKRIVQVSEASVENEDQLNEFERLPNLQKIKLSIKDANLSEALIDRLAKFKALDTLWVQYISDDQPVNADGQPAPENFIRRTHELLAKLPGVKIGGTFSRSSAANIRASD